MMKLKNCPFCEDRIRNAVFMETENFMVVYNNAPILPSLLGQNLFDINNTLTSRCITKQ